VLGRALYAAEWENRLGTGLMTNDELKANGFDVEVDDED
jgi:hypothetical protein